MTEQQAVDHAITSRMSARAFTQQAVSREMITEILQVASRAPSGTNTQPWQVHVLTGAAKQRLSERIEFIHEYTASDALVEEYIEGREVYVGAIGNERITTLPPTVSARMEQP